METSSVIRIHAFVCLVVWALAGNASAQTPAIAAGGVVNGASFRPSAAPGGGVAAGSIVTIFGSNFGSPGGAASVPLPQTISGTSVTFGGRVAGLFFVSPTQINALLPWDVPLGTQPVVVRTAAGASAAENVTVVANSPAIFSRSQNGRGPGAILNADNRANDFAVSIAPGGVLQIFAVGLAVAGPPATGAVGNDQAPSTPVTVLIGGRTVTPQFAGLSSQFVGLFQINAAVPSNTPEGCFLPVQLQVGSGTAAAFSNVVTVSVASSGNCNSAATGSVTGGINAAVGSIALSRTTLQLNLPVPVPGLGGPIGSLSAGFFRVGVTGAATASGFPPAGGGCVVEVGRADSAETVPFAGNFSGGATFTFLDAGSLTYTPPSGGSQPVPRISAGTYAISSSASNPSGLNIQAGSHQVRGGGGTDVGAFTATLNLAALFNVTSSGVPSSNTLSQAAGITSTWTCPDPAAQVVGIATSYNTTTKVFGQVICSVACGDARITIGSDLLRQIPTSSAQQAGYMLMFVPAISSGSRFSATGLDFGFFIYSDLSLYQGLTLNP